MAIAVGQVRSIFLAPAASSFFKQSLQNLATSVALKSAFCGRQYLGQVSKRFAILCPGVRHGSGSDWLTDAFEVNDVVGVHWFALTKQASVTHLLHSRNHCSPREGRVDTPAYRPTTLKPGRLA